MEKLLCTLQQRMGAMMLHRFFLVMVLLLKSKQMCFFLLPYDPFFEEFKLKVGFGFLMEGMTPLNHLSPGPRSEKLWELLNWHLGEQRKRRAIEACSETKAKTDELENEISNVVGLHELKVHLRKWAREMLLDERRRTPHMAFLGNPGSD